MRLRTGSLLAILPSFLLGFTPDDAWAQPFLYNADYEWGGPAGVYTVSTSTLAVREGEAEFEASWLVWSTVPLEATRILLAFGWSLRDASGEVYTPLVYDSAGRRFVLLAEDGETEALSIELMTDNHHPVSRTDLPLSYARTRTASQTYEAATLVPTDELPSIYVGDLRGAGDTPTIQVTYRMRGQLDRARRSALALALVTESDPCGWRSGAAPCRPGEEPGGSDAGAAGPHDASDSTGVTYRPPSRTEDSDGAPDTGGSCDCRTRIDDRPGPWSPLFVLLLGLVFASRPLIRTSRLRADPQTPSLAPRARRKEP